VSSKSDIAKLPTTMRQYVRSLTGAVMEPGSTHVVVTTKSTVQHEGYRIVTLSMQSDANSEVSGLVAIPDGSAVKPAILMMDSLSNPDIDRLVKAGRIVMVIEPRPTPPGTESIKSPYLGAFNLLSLRAFLVGKTIIGLRIDDTIRAMDWLSSRKDVDRKAITVYGNGPLGMVALHAAALDTRISKVVAANTLASYLMIVDQPVHRNVSEVVIPGVLLYYDTDDLLIALHPRPVVYVSPRDALGDAISEASFRTAMEETLRWDQKRGSPKRIQFQTVADFR